MSPWLTYCKSITLLLSWTTVAKCLTVEIPLHWNDSNQHKSSQISWFNLNLNQSWQHTVGTRADIQVAGFSKLKGHGDNQHYVYTTYSRINTVQVPLKAGRFERATLRSVFQAWRLQEHFLVQLFMIIWSNVRWFINICDKKNTWNWNQPRSVLSHGNEYLLFFKKIHRL